MDLSSTKHVFKAGTSYVQQNLDKKRFNFLKEYFDVNNAFIYDKIKLILWPFNTAFDFVYKPDLYIPIVSLITLVVFKCLIHGFNNSFHPEKLFFMLSRNFAVLMGLPILYLGLGFILSSGISYMPILCFSGYKYVVLVFIRLFLCFLPKFVAYPIGLYLIIAYFLFFSRSIKTFIQKKGNREEIKLNFVFGMGISEVILIILMHR